MQCPINLDLLHRRLGHISTNTLIFGSKQDSWHDVSAVSNGSTFCAPCKLMMMPKTRRSHTPVTRPLIPGDIGAFDIVPNPCITPLTQDCNYNYLLLCMDICTRRCEIFGMEVRHRTLKWETSGKRGVDVGPARDIAGYNVYNPIMGQPPRAMIYFSTNRSKARSRIKFLRKPKTVINFVTSNYLAVRWIHTMNAITLAPRNNQKAVFEQRQSPRNHTQKTSTKILQNK